MFIFILILCERFIHPHYLLLMIVLPFAVPRAGQDSLTLHAALWGKQQKLALQFGERCKYGGSGDHLTEVFNGKNFWFFFNQLLYI